MSRNKSASHKLLLQQANDYESSDEDYQSEDDVEEEGSSSHEHSDMEAAERPLHGAVDSSACKGPARAASVPCMYKYEFPPLSKVKVIDSQKPLTLTAPPQAATPLANPSVTNLFPQNRAQGSGYNFVDKSFPDVDGEDVLIVGKEELMSIEESWGYCLVGFVAGKFPGMLAFNNLAANSWKVSCDIIPHPSGWLVFRFASDIARDSVLSKGPYQIYGRGLILRTLPPCFRFDTKLLSIVPLWVQLPNLPLDCWSEALLWKIAKRLGTPIATDELTKTRKRVAFARLLVEIDLSKDLVKSFKMRLPGVGDILQEVTYESIPKFCSSCKTLGHTTSGCASSKTKVAKPKSTAQGSTNHQVFPSAKATGQDKLKGVASTASKPIGGLANGSLQAIEAPTKTAHEASTSTVLPDKNKGPGAS